MLCTTSGDAALPQPLRRLFKASVRGLPPLLSPPCSVNICAYAWVAGAIAICFSCCILVLLVSRRHPASPLPACKDTA